MSEQTDDTTITDPNPISPGFYWVRNSGVRVAEFDGSQWWFAGSEMPGELGSVVVVSPKLSRPDEAPRHD